MSKKLDIAILRFKFHRPISTWEVALARGFFGNAFRGEVLAHHHLISDEGVNSASKVLYRYPLVQYKALDGDLLILGIEEGVNLVNRFAHFEYINLNSNRLAVVETYFHHCKGEFGISESQIKYQFVTPWLALNEKNIKKYKRCQSFREARQMLGHILVANILSMAKGLGYTVENKICTTIHARQCNCSLKGNPMLGFIGTFSSNFKLPSYSGLGKSVSRGYGTIARISTVSDEDVYFRPTDARPTPVVRR